MSLSVQLMTSHKESLKTRCCRSNQRSSNWLLVSMSLSMQLMNSHKESLKTLRAEHKAEMKAQAKVRRPPHT